MDGQEAKKAPYIALLPRSSDGGRFQALVTCAINESDARKNAGYRFRGAGLNNLQRVVILNPEITGIFTEEDEANLSPEELREMRIFALSEWVQGDAGGYTAPIDLEVISACRDYYRSVERFRKS